MKIYVSAILALFLSVAPAASDTTVKATWYQCCKRTANGERFNPNGMTAAHRSMPFGTHLRVSHKGKSVVVRINDRGPFRRGYSLDLARGAAFALGCRGSCLVSYVVMR